MTGFDLDAGEMPQYGESVGTVGALHLVCPRTLLKIQRPPLRPRLRIEPQPELMGRPQQVTKKQHKVINITAVKLWFF